MGLNFLENLGFNEAPTPLANLAELDNNSGKSQEESMKQDEDDTQITAGHTDSNALPSITELDTTSVPADKSKDSNTTNTSTNKKYISFLKELNEKIGIIEDFKEEDLEDNMDTILDYLEEWSDNTAESKLDTHIKQSLNPEIQRYLDLVDSGVNRDVAINIMKDHKALAAITPEKITEDVETAKDVYAQYLRNTTTFSSEKIKKEVDRIEKLGTIEEEAKEIFPELLKIVDTREKQAVAQAQKEEQLAKLKEEREVKETQEFLNSTNEIGGIKLNKRTKDKWIKEYAPVRTPDGKLVPPVVQTRVQNPTEFDALLRFYHSIGLFNIDGKSKQFKPDFTALKSLGGKETLDKFSDAVASEQAKSKKGGISPDSIDITPDKKEHLDRAKEIADYMRKMKETNSNLYNIDASQESSNY